MNIAEEMERAFSLDPDKPIVEYKGEVLTRREVAEVGRAIFDSLAAANIPMHAPVGLLSRNRPMHFATLAGLMRYGRSVMTLHAFQDPQKLARDVASLKLCALVGESADWSDVVVDAAKEAGTLGIILNLSNRSVSLVPGLETVGPGEHAPEFIEAGVEILSSGTTGPPKRILLPYRIQEQALKSTQKASPSGASSATDIFVWPMSAISGVAMTLNIVIRDQYLVLLDKFNVDEWAAAIAKHKPLHTSGPATVARMVIDANVPPEALASLQYFYGGGGAMAPELQEEFESRYNLKVIWAYGATEFCGTVITWTPELYDQFDATKRGAMGRAMPGISLRVVDCETGDPLPAGELGFLEAIVPTIGDSWIHTNDLCLIDEDGFVFHRGRGDGAIVRGGFKILPEQVADAIRSHPAVRDAVVIGVTDRRLGAVPVAAVEMWSDAQEPPDIAGLTAFLRTRIALNHVPTRFLLVDALPRTRSLKIDLGAVRTLFESVSV